MNQTSISNAQKSITTESLLTKTQIQIIEAIATRLREHYKEILRSQALPQLPACEQTSICLEGDFEVHPMGKILLQAYNQAMALNHNLPDWIVTMDGMSGKKYRYLVNNLIAKLNSAVYMEVGSWSGSTACAALWNNPITVTCIDDWSQFGGPRNKFIANIRKAKHANATVRTIECDFRNINFSLIKPLANIYLFDGPHGEQDQYDGVAMALPALQSSFILIVDDYNAKSVRVGTQRAIQGAGLTIRCSIQIKTTTNDSHPTVCRQNSDWHNGYLIALCEKTK